MRPANKYALRPSQHASTHWLGPSFCPWPLLLYPSQHFHHHHMLNPTHYLSKNPWCSHQHLSNEWSPLSFRGYLSIQCFSDMFEPGYHGNCNVQFSFDQPDITSLFYLHCMIASVCKYDKRYWKIHPSPYHLDDVERHIFGVIFFFFSFHFWKEIFYVMVLFVLGRMVSTRMEVKFYYLKNSWSWLEMLCWSKVCINRVLILFSMLKKRRTKKETGRKW